MAIRTETTTMYVTDDGKKFEDIGKARDHDRLRRMTLIFRNRAFNGMAEAELAAEVLIAYWSDFQAIWNEHFEPLPEGTKGRSVK